jgi:hypothetical protein
VTGDVQAYLPARVVALHPRTRTVTAALRPVGRGQSYRGQFVGAAEELAPVIGVGTSHRLGRVVKVNPTPGGGAEVSMVVADDDAWGALAAGSAKIDALVAFVGSRGGDPVDGRPLRIEIG